MLIEVHLLKSFPANCLNRDDTGEPKSCVFGGTNRARISSQCIKRAVRKSPQFAKILDCFNDEGFAYRTRRLPILVSDLLKEKNPDLSNEYILAIQDRVSRIAKAETKAGKSPETEDSTKKEKAKETQENSTPQVMFIGKSDIQAIAADIEAYIKAGNTAKDLREAADITLFKSAKTHRLAQKSPDIAVFGRMTTSSFLDDVDSAVQVAHAFSTTSLVNQYDYYTAVDELNADDELGAAMIGDIGYNTSCYYMYANINTDILMYNFHLSTDAFREGNDDKLEGILKCIKHFVEAFIVSLPTGKQNTFAAHTLPSLVLVEISDTCMPFNCANAFIHTSKRGTNIIEDAIAKLVMHSEAFKTAYPAMYSKISYLLQPEYTTPAGTFSTKVHSLSDLLDSLENTVSGYLTSGELDD